MIILECAHGQVLVDLGGRVQPSAFTKTKPTKINSGAFFLVFHEILYLQKLPSIWYTH